MSEQEQEAAVFDMSALIRMGHLIRPTAEDWHAHLFRTAGHTEQPEDGEQA